MNKEKRLMIRMSEEDYQRLEAYAKQKDVSMAKVLRDYIKRLPDFSKINKHEEEGLRN